MSPSRLPESTPPDRRARNKRRTRDALTRAAMELAAEQGFAETSVDQIADRAGVSPRTFSRYFESKEDVLVPFDPLGISIDAIVEQPDSLSDLSAVIATFRAMGPAFEDLREQIRLLRLALASSASLRGRDFDQRTRTEADIARALAVRRGSEGPDAGQVLAANIAFAVVRRAMDLWLDAPAGTPLGPLLDEQFAGLLSLVADEHPGSRG